MVTFDFIQVMEESWVLSSLRFQAEVAALNVLLVWKVPLLKGRLSVAGFRMFRQVA